MSLQNTYLSLVGKNIICECVKHTPVHNPNKSTMIINRPIKVNFTHKSHNRTGKPCYAYVNSAVKFNLQAGTNFFVSPEVDTYNILIKLNQKYNREYNLFFTSGIYGNKLIGECSKIKFEDISHWSKVHGGQRISMHCNEFVLCYVEIPHEMANMKFSAT